MSSRIALSGITWRHTRGFLPMVATAQRYTERHPEVDITWRMRSLQAFADQSIEALAQKFDLLVIDHPSIGEAAHQRLFVPLDEHLQAAFLRDQTENSVGASHSSYHYAGHQWALATDAATPVAAMRPDVLEKRGFTPPQTWDDLLELARAGLVVFAGLPLDCLMHWYTFCVNEGQTPFAEPADKGIVNTSVGLAALEAIRELTDLCGPESIQRNPIAAYEALSESDLYAYSPLAYGYANYSRRGYAQFRLQFGEPVKRRNVPLHTTLGGAGLAVSARLLAEPEKLQVALNYAQFVASAKTQTGIYTQSGGQAGHRAAWLDGENNALFDRYFSNTLPALDRAFVRPRHAHAIAFQTDGTSVMQKFLRHECSAAEALTQFNSLHQRWSTTHDDGASP